MSTNDKKRFTLHIDKLTYQYNELSDFQLLPALTALSLFPMGTFRVWTVWRPAAALLVYPAPEPHPPALPPGQPA